MMSKRDITPYYEEFNFFSWIIFHLHTLILIDMCMVEKV